ncbi:protein WEAK CHLOROPLAST MOVEMENT UNDER BLUE LIGHT 1-like isoform X1 [Wolffia australiana]
MEEPKEADKVLSSISSPSDSSIRNSSTSANEDQEVKEQKIADEKGINGGQITESSEESLNDISDLGQTLLPSLSSLSDALKGLQAATEVDSPKLSQNSNFTLENQGKGEFAGASGDEKLNSRSLIDTAAPFESVKEAVSKFGGIVDWKAHRAVVIERQKQLQVELEKTVAVIPAFQQKSAAAERAKMEVLKELETTKSAIEELRLSLESSQREEAQAKQDSEMAQLQAAEMAQGIATEAGAAAKAQLEVTKARHTQAESELTTAREELETMKAQLQSLVYEKEAAEDKAATAQFSAREAEKAAEELTMELISAREALEAAQAAHLEAEEHRIGTSMARDQDLFNWDKELKEAQAEVDRLAQQLAQARELKSTLESASETLVKIKGELAVYTAESAAEDGAQSGMAAMKRELEEVRGSIEKTKGEVNFLKVASASLAAELEKEQAALTPMKQREGMASVAVSSLETELGRVNAEIETARVKEREAREEMVELPRALQKAAVEADEAKLAALVAQDELKKVKEEFEQVKASVGTVESRVLAAMKEIEAAKATERLALAAVRALQESEQAAIMEPGDDAAAASVTLPLEDYLMLSKRAREAEELASEKVNAAVAQIEAAKAAEARTLASLAEAMAELEAKKEALKAATEKADKANEGKLAVEQELRMWRAEHEQRRRSSSAARAANSASAALAEVTAVAATDQSPTGIVEQHQELTPAPAAVVVERTPSPPRRRRGNEKASAKEGKGDVAAASPETKARKKKSLFPQLSKLLGKKKA